MKLFLDYGMPKWLVSMAMVSVTGLALAGYTVYKCVVTAVVFAGDEHLFLAESLFIPGRALRVLRRARVRLVQVRRLRDFDIAVFAEALRRAFHLAVVSIVILETVTPAFYELVLPQGGVDKPWLGGVGKVVLRAQQTSNFELIAGCIWCVLFFDWIVVSIIDATLWRRWLRFQRKGVRP
ncbi:MAG: hypothetical protein LAO05_14570 [Acidobacteriia bacterium]|nr:hypothetical protein [Terriglobia bacterium]